MKLNTLKLTLIMVFCSVSLVLTAQKNDSAKTIRNVQIEREYTPEVVPVERPNINLQVENLRVQKAKPAYSNYIKLYEIQAAPIIPLQPKELGALNRETPKAGFFRLGLGPLFRWLGDFWYPVWNTDYGYFDIFASHDGILSVGNVPPKKLFNTKIGLNFNKNFDGLQFYLSAIYANEWFTYYGTDTALQTNNNARDWDDLFAPKQSFNKSNFVLGLRTLDRDGNEMLWNGYLNYKLFSSDKHISEHNINAIFSFDKLIDDNSLSGEGGAKVFFYNNRDSVAMKELPTVMGIDSARWKPNVILFLNPALKLDFDEVKIKLGVKSFYSFGRTPAVAISPDVKIDYLLDDFLNLYAGISGDYTINSLAHITQRNRYYNMSAVGYNTYTPFDAFAGFKVKVLKGLMVDASVGYKYAFNAMFFKNDAFFYGTDTCYNRFFEATFYNGGFFHANARLSYNIKERANIFASMEYIKGSLSTNNIQSLALPWHTPRWRINAGTDFKVGKNFFGGLNFYFASTMQAEQFAWNNANNTKQTIIDLPSTYDLNLNAGYNASKNVSIFAQLNNILAISPSLNPQVWYGYQTMGFNGLIGFSVQF